jgi:ribosome maturation factor RimP
MLSKEKILGFINDLVVEKQLFIISLDISATNNIRLVVDSIKGVSIDECVALSRAIENNFDREVEDFELEVSSASLSDPFKVQEQYLKNIGREVEILLSNGKMEKGILLSADEKGFSIEQEKQVKIEGKKKKQRIKEIHKLNYNEGSRVRIVIKF